MSINSKRITTISIICICVLALSLGFGMGNIVCADGGLEDGIYTVPFESSTLSDMGMMAFENKARQVIVEKVGTTYYMTVSFDGNNIKDVELIDSNGKVGCTMKKDGTINRYTYTLSEVNISKSIAFKGHIIAMDTDKEFDFIPVLSKAVRTGDADATIERPAEYVPVLTTDISNAEVEKGSLYLIPTASAKLGSEVLPVTTKVYYEKESKREEVDIVDGRVLLSNAGNYYVVMHAESDKYKTNLGNNTYVTKEVKIVSKVGATSIAKIVYDREAENEILPANSVVTANYVTSGDVFDKATNAMKEVADSFEIITVDIVDSNGQSIQPNSSIELYLRANDAFNRNSLEVYLLGNDGSIVRQDVENYGRYVQLNTKNTGTYIICQPGVAYHMPMWGIATLTILGVLIVVAAIVIPVVLVLRKKKKDRLSEADSGNNADEVQEK